MGRTCAEPEVNNVILAWGGDHCVSREALCAEGFMVRDKRIYERIREAAAELVATVEPIVDHGHYPAIRLRKVESAKK